MSFLSHVVMGGNSVDDPHALAVPRRRRRKFVLNLFFAIPALQVNSYRHFVLRIYCKERAGDFLFNASIIINLSSRLIACAAALAARSILLCIRVYTIWIICSFHLTSRGSAEFLSRALDQSPTVREKYRSRAISPKGLSRTLYTFFCSLTRFT